MKQLTIDLSEGDYDLLKEWTESQFNGDFNWSFKWLLDSHRGMVFDGNTQAMEAFQELSERVSNLEKVLSERKEEVEPLPVMADGKKFTKMGGGGR